MSLIGAVLAAGDEPNRWSFDFLRLAASDLSKSESVKQLGFAHDTSYSPAGTKQATTENSSWSDMSPVIMGQIISLLSDQLMTSSAIWPKDTRLPSLRLVCHHWHDTSSKHLCSLCFSAQQLVLYMLARRGLYQAHTPC